MAAQPFLRDESDNENYLTVGVDLLRSDHLFQFECKFASLLHEFFDNSARTLLQLLLEGSGCDGRPV